MNSILVNINENEVGKNRKNDGKVKRPALATITNQHIRIQPARAAKPKEKFNVPFKPASHAAVKVESGNREQLDMSEAMEIAVAEVGECLKVTDDVEMSDNTTDSTDDESSADSNQMLKGLLDCEEYANQIYKYLRVLELKHQPKPNYMKKQPDISYNMRNILVDWLIEVAEEYKLQRETIFLAINYIDRFLSQMSVLRGKLQLVGAAAMFLAAKYEEIYPPDVGEFVYITDDTYTKKQVLRMEHLILKVLSFDVAVPTANLFCERFLNDCGASSKTSSLAMYMLELSLVEADPFLHYLPSVIAGASVCLARQMLYQDPWTVALMEKAGYTMSDLLPCMRDLSRMLTAAVEHPQQAIREKYRQSKFHQVATLPAPTLHLAEGFLS